MAGPVVVPFVIQVQQHVKAPVQLPFEVVVVVDMEPQAAARQRLVQPAAVQVGVRHQPLDARQLLQEADEAGTVELDNQGAQRRRNGVEVLDLELQVLGGGAEGEPDFLVGAGECGAGLAVEAVVQEIVDTDMRKRRGATVGLRKLARHPVQLGNIQQILVHDSCLLL
ncbi:hypothetical protein D3C72_789950 [compost metagenome]